MRTVTTREHRPTTLFGGLVLVALMWAAPADSPVADAAMRGETETVRALLRGGADVNAAQSDGMTALHWAAHRGDSVMAEVVVYAGGNVGAVTRLGDYTPLHLASGGGHAGVVRALLRAGAAPTAVTTTGATPLHFAAAGGDPKTVDLLLDHGADIDATEPQWGQTPLMFAAAADRVDAVSALLTRGADANVAAKVVDIRERQTVDSRDRQRRNRRMAALQALESGDSTPSESPRQNRFSFQTRPGQPRPLSYGDLVGTHGGLTALLLATREGHFRTVEALLEAGIDINQPSAADGTTPLLIATINGHFDLAMWLLNRGADPTAESEAGATPLYTTLNTEWAPKSRHPQPTAAHQQQTTYLELMGALLDAGANPNVRLRKQLWYTTYNNDLLGVNRTGATPFWRAAYATDLRAMRLLIAAGADPNVPTEKVPERRFREDVDAEEDPSGLPPVPVGGPAVYPIHAASGVGYGQGYAANSHRHVPDGWLPAVRYLVEELGANVNQRDHNGYTPLHHAAARGDNEMILYLVGQGANPTAVARSGQTTVDLANGPVQRIQPFPETIALLESMGAKNNHNCLSCD